MFWTILTYLPSLYLKVRDRICTRIGTSDDQGIQILCTALLHAMQLNIYVPFLRLIHLQLLPYPYIYICFLLEWRMLIIAYNRT